MVVAPARPLRIIVALAASHFALGSRRHRGAPLKEQWPWYHSGQELRSAFQELAASCSGAEATVTTLSRINSQEAAGQEVQIDALRIRRQGASVRAKAMFVFGEHARELITGEAALGLARALCGKGPGTKRADQVLSSVEFVLVPNANPIGRNQVESGYYCKRTNEDGVDLNRNWSDEHRDTSLPMGDEMYPGPGGFSEPETQLLRELLDQERPDIYLSVHSGAYLLGMPYGYESDRPAPDEGAMLEVLRPISDKFCAGGCPFGNLAKLINYDNPGCDIDYVYDRLKTPYVFTWEIYVGEDFRGRYVEEARMRRGRGGAEGAASLAQQDRRKARRRGRSALRARGPEAAEDVGSCMDQFNPQTQDETAAVVENWSSAFLELCAEVSARRDQRDTPVAAPSATSPSPPRASLSEVVLDKSIDQPGIDGARPSSHEEAWESDLKSLRAWDVTRG